MSVQDKVERVLKEIHILFSESQEVSGETDKIIVNKKEVFSLLEKLNRSMYEVMENYEATERSRELSQRRNELKSQKIVERANGKVEDIYAAAMIYTEDALGRIQKIMEDAAASAQQIFGKMNTEFEEEKVRVNGNQSELREQLQDFKDTNKYLAIIEDCNRQREKKGKEAQVTEKRIPNEPKHYTINEKPEIKVNPAYLVRRGIIAEEETTGGNPVGQDSMIESLPEEGSVSQGDIPPEGIPQENISLRDASPKQDFIGSNKISVPSGEEQPCMAEKPEIRVDLDAEYFKWRDGEKSSETEETKPVTEKKERRFLFGKK